MLACCCNTFTVPFQCSSWFGRSVNFFSICNWATRMMLSLPIYRWFMSIFQCPRLFTSPLIITTSPTLILNVLSLSFSLRDTRYSYFHIFHKASLHRLIYLCRFFIVLLSLSWVLHKGNLHHAQRSNYLESKSDSQFLHLHRLIACCWVLFLTFVLTQPMSTVLSQ